MTQSDKNFLQKLLRQSPGDRTPDGLPRIVRGSPIDYRIRNGRKEYKIIIDGKGHWIDETRLDYYEK